MKRHLSTIATTQLNNKDLLHPLCQKEVESEAVIQIYVFRKWFMNARMSRSHSPTPIHHSI